MAWVQCIYVHSFFIAEVFLFILPSVSGDIYLQSVLKAALYQWWTMCTLLESLSLIPLALCAEIYSLTSAFYVHGYVFIHGGMHLYCNIMFNMLLFLGELQLSLSSVLCILCIFVFWWQAWDAWEARQMEEVFDPKLYEGSQLREIKRCVKVGLLCLQSDRADRPTMADVLEMLHGKKQLPTLKKPAYMESESDIESVTEGSCNSVDWRRKAFTAVDTSRWQLILIAHSDDTFCVDTWQ